MQDQGVRIKRITKLEIETGEKLMENMENNEKLFRVGPIRPPAKQIVYYCK